MSKTVERTKVWRGGLMMSALLTAFEYLLKLCSYMWWRPIVPLHGSAECPAWGNT